MSSTHYAHPSISNGVHSAQPSPQLTGNLLLSLVTYVKMSIYELSCEAAWDSADLVKLNLLVLHV